MILKKEMASYKALVKSKSWGARGRSIYKILKSNGLSEKEMLIKNFNLFFRFCS